MERSRPLRGGLTEFDPRSEGGQGEVRERVFAGHGPRGPPLSKIPGKKQKPTPGDRRSEHALGQRPGKFGSDWNLQSKVLVPGDSKIIGETVNTRGFSRN